MNKITPGIPQKIKSEKHKGALYPTGTINTARYDIHPRFVITFDGPEYRWESIIRNCVFADVKINQDKYDEKGHPISCKTEKECFENWQRFADIHGITDYKFHHFRGWWDRLQFVKIEIHGREYKDRFYAAMNEYINLSCYWEEGVSLLCISSVGSCVDEKEKKAVRKKMKTDGRYKRMMYLKKILSTDFEKVWDYDNFDEMIRYNGDDDGKEYWRKRKAEVLSGSKK